MRTLAVIVGILISGCGQNTAPAPTSGPIDGKWGLRNVLCGGTPSNLGMFTATNSAPAELSTVELKASTGERVWSVGICTTRVPMKNIRYEENTMLVDEEPLVCEGNCAGIPGCGGGGHTGLQYSFSTSSTAPSPELKIGIDRKVVSLAAGLCGANQTRDQIELVYTKLQ